MATLTVQPILLSGLATTYTAAAGGGDAFATDATTFLHVKNGGGGAITATISTPGAVLGTVGIEDVAVSVPAGGERMIGPFPKEYFETSTGLAAVTYSGVTTVTVAAIKLQQV